MKYELHPEAELELYEAAWHYEALVPELGRRFADEVERVIQLLVDHPELAPRLSARACSSRLMWSLQELKGIVNDPLAEH